MAGRIRKRFYLFRNKAKGKCLLLMALLIVLLPIIEVTFNPTFTSAANEKCDSKEFQGKNDWAKYDFSVNASNLSVSCMLEFATMKATAYDRAMMLRMCFRKARLESNGRDYKKARDATGHVFTGEFAISPGVFSRIMDEVNCYPSTDQEAPEGPDPQWVTDAFSALGISKGRLLCTMGYTAKIDEGSDLQGQWLDKAMCLDQFSPGGVDYPLYASGNNETWCIKKNDNGTNCKTLVKDWKESETAFKTTLYDLIGLNISHDGPTDNFGNDYVTRMVYLNKILLSGVGCDLQANPDGSYSIYDMEEINSKLTVHSGNRNRDEKMPYYTFIDSGEKQFKGDNIIGSQSCGNMQDMFNSDYLKYIEQLSLKACSSYDDRTEIKYGRANDASGSDLKATEEDACQDGFKNKSLASYCEKYKESSKLKSACESGQKFADDIPVVAGDVGDVGDDGEIGTETESTCAIDGIGWLVCPVLDFMGKIADGMQNILNGFMEIQPSMFEEGQEAKIAYNGFIPLANIVLVIVFLVIIYSAATGSGFGALSNYDIKKILPRLVIFAVLINISWYICAALVDLSNITGASMNGFITSADPEIEIAKNAGNSTAVWSSIVASVLVVGGGLMFNALPALIPALLAVIVAVLMMFLILIVRQAAIVLLCVIAPLAFAMAMLPNTQSLFKKWWSTFSKLLLIYPIIGIIFGASKVAGNILIAQGQGNPAVGDADGSWYLQLAGAACQVLPLFAVPMVLKGSLKALGALGAAVGGFAAGRMSSATARLKNKAKEGYNRSSFGRGQNIRKQARQEYHDNKFARKAAGSGRTGWYTRAAAGGFPFPMTGAQRHAKRQLPAMAQQAAAKATAEQVGNHEKQIAKLADGDLNEVAKALREAVKAGNEERAQAAQNILLKSGTPGQDMFRDTMEGRVKDENGKVDVDTKFLQALGDKKGKMDRSLRANVRENHALKGQAGDIDAWSTQEESKKTTLSVQTGSASSYNALTPAELISQKGRAWQNAVQSIDADTANHILTSDLRGQLTQQQAQDLRARLNPPPPPQGGAGTTP
jgi:hypothetical protein